MKADQIITVLKPRPSLNSPLIGVPCEASVSAGLPTSTVWLSNEYAGLILLMRVRSSCWRPCLSKKAMDSGMVFKITGINNTGRPAT
ncbi:hypothetical protein D3C84_1176770 [compost metagenome]